MNLSSIRTWTSEFNQFLKNDEKLIRHLNEKLFTIIICPPFPFLPLVKYDLRQYPFLKIGVQTVSTYENGKYTGEVTATAVKDFAEYAIIGHSEQRAHRNLTEQNITDQLNHCKNNNIESVLCVSGEKNRLHDAKIIAYEPVEAIGTGQNAELEKVIAMKKTLNIDTNKTFLYGGSADQHNIEEYLKSGKIDGFLVGTASLRAVSFYAMAQGMNRLL